MFKFYKQLNRFQLIFSYFKETSSKMPFYAVARGHKSGIYKTWDECQNAVLNVKHAKYKKFSTREEAQQFIDMFKGHVYESTTCQKLPVPPDEEKPAFEISDEDTFSTQEFTDHLERIDKIAEQYKETLMTEINSFRKSISVVLNQIEKRNFSTLLSSGNNLKRKQNSSSDEHEEKILKLENSLNDKLENEFSIDNDGFIHVYTDGACENNGRINAKAGLGVWFGPNHPLNIGEPIVGRPTNNVGEIQACTKAIEIAHAAGAKKLCINTDSQFVINSMTTWIKGWKKKNWLLKDGTPVKNKSDFIKLDDASKLLEIKWNYVKGHAGIIGNEGADTLAKKGAQNYKK